MEAFLQRPGEAILKLDESSLRFVKDFLSTQKKDEFLTEVSAFLKSSNFRRVRDDLLLITDELFTNFSKSAPVSESPISFGIESNDDSVVIYCRDRFGLLDPQRMLENMQRCFQQGVKDAIRQDSNTGAGIGSFLIFSVGVGMAITVLPKQGSLVAIWMPRNSHHEDRIEMKKSLIIIEGKES